VKQIHMLSKIQLANLPVACMQPYHIVLNQESDRKTPNAVSFVNGERFFGTSAQNTAVNRPTDALLFAQNLLGRQASDKSLQFFNEGRFPIQWIADSERGTYRVKLSDDRTFSIEEVMAMILEYAQGLASAEAGVRIADAVIAVPPFLTQQQRQAVLDAAKIAGITVTGLINDNTATALLYGIEKEKEFKDLQERNVVFFDMGASSTRVSVVRFGTAQSKADKKANKTVGEYWIKSVAWDESLGAVAFDNVIMEAVATGFNAKRNVKDGAEKDVRNFAKAMSKIRKNAEKTKEVNSIFFFFFFQ
jgi:hypoxia up-regulated 1